MKLQAIIVKTEFLIEERLNGIFDSMISVSAEKLIRYYPYNRGPMLSNFKNCSPDLQTE